MNTEIMNSIRSLANNVKKVQSDIRDLNRSKYNPNMNDSDLNFSHKDILETMLNIYRYDIEDIIDKIKEHLVQIYELGFHWATSPIVIELEDNNMLYRAKQVESTILSLYEELDNCKLENKKMK